MLVAVVNVVCAQCCIQVMNQRDIGRVIQRSPFRNQTHAKQNALSVFMPLLSQEHLVRFFVDGEVARRDDAFPGAGIGFTLLTRHLRHDLVHRQVHGRVVFGLTADDQRCTRLVDQDGVDLVNDGEVQPTLHAVGHFVDHVVAQVIKTVFVVGSVGNVRAIGRLLFFAAHLRQINADTQTQKVVELAHPARISAGQVIVDRDHVHALARQRIEVHRQGGRECFALPSAHL